VSFFLAVTCKEVDFSSELAIMQHMGNINIRDNEGRVFRLKGALCIEICDSEDALLAVMTLEDRGMQRVKLVYPGDVEFARYKRIFAKQEGKLVAVRTNWQERKKAKWQE
jgi:hypothetical protein